jgi:hypothetical protein
MQEESKSQSPLLVAVAGLVLPGLGYVLIGQRRRGLIIGLTLLLMFFGGILVAGIRVFEVPGYGYGQDKPDLYGKLYIEYYPMRDGLYAKSTTEPAINIEPMASRSPGGSRQVTVFRRAHDGAIRQEPESLANAPVEPGQWLLLTNFRGEIANRIWFVPQALMGAPTAVASYFSISAGLADVPQSHARLAEIGTLYTAVAGMLNLLVVIDAASRCGRKEES